MKEEIKEDEHLRHQLKMKAIPKGSKSGWAVGYYWLGLNGKHYIKHEVSEGSASWLVDTEIDIHTLRPYDCTGKSDKQVWVLVDVKN